MIARFALAAALSLAVALPAAAAPAPPASALARLPVREVTVFKDGHAFVLHQGQMPVDGAGNVVMDYLPTPVLGTFWPYSADKDTPLSSVVASVRRLRVERTALTLRELLEANVGVAAVITEVGGLKYDAVIAGFPQRDGEELEATSPPNAGEMLPQKGGVVLLRTARGVKVVPIERIIDVTFKEKHNTRVADEEFRSLLTLKMDWAGRPAKKTAPVGMMYLQRGVRWIPSYKVTIDGAGNAVVKLQATLINELTDLQDVTANLVVGVPTFQFADTPDPVGLQQAVAQLGRYFQPNSPTALGLSNSIMSQAGGFGGRFGETRGDAPAGPPADLGPVVAGTEKSEDLFVFTVKHVSM
ncbi:MAG TPA: hypothetical protein VK689_04870, partial [Armatimonadota bacterium]|nr:hypothetical protein [Armatimonadota bacterium]